VGEVKVHPSFYFSLLLLLPFFSSQTGSDMKMMKMKAMLCASDNDDNDDSNAVQMSNNDSNTVQMSDNDSNTVQVSDNNGNTMQAQLCERRQERAGGGAGRHASAQASNDDSRQWLQVPMACTPTHVEDRYYLVLNLQYILKLAGTFE
jgi:hypothetical protein